MIRIRGKIFYKSNKEEAWVRTHTALIPSAKGKKRQKARKHEGEAAQQRRKVGMLDDIINGRS